MNRIWKDFRTNLMYWRFRYITRNRLKLQSAWYRRRQPQTGYRPRASAQFVYQRTSRRTWVILVVMVAALTLYSWASSHGTISASIAYAADALTIGLALYVALRYR